MDGRMDGKQLRIVYMGTPEFAVTPLRSLVEAGYNVAGVVTMPDKPAGRGLKIHQSAVKKYAVEAGLPVLQPEKLKDQEFIDELRALNADLGIVIAFRMLPEVVWAMPRFGTFNLHASLLPQYRGAAPINWSIINGDTFTGVTTFMLNHEIDKGDILGRSVVEISPEDNAGTLHDKLMAAGDKLVIETVEKIAAGDAQPIPQAAGFAGSESGGCAGFAGAGIAGSVGSESGGGSIAGSVGAGGVAAGIAGSVGSESGGGGAGFAGAGGMTAGITGSAGSESGGGGAGFAGAGGMTAGITGSVGSESGGGSELKEAPKIFKETCRVDWTADCRTIHNLVRGLSPYPAAWSKMVAGSMRTAGGQGAAANEGEPISVKIFETSMEEAPGVAGSMRTAGGQGAAADNEGAGGTEAIMRHGEDAETKPGAIISDGKKYIKVACGNGYISLLDIQIAGKKRMKTEELLRGFKNIESYTFE